MIATIKVPKLDANTEEVTITAWFKKEGDKVAKGEKTVEMTTDKAAFEVESPKAGVLRKIFADKKSIVPIGYVVGVVAGAGDVLPDIQKANSVLMEKHRIKSGRKAADAPEKPAGGGTRQAVRATPAARRLAREKGIDLASISGKMKSDIINEEALLKYLQKESK